MTARFGFVSTYPPTLCGLATFTAALRAELTTPGASPGPVVRLVETPQAGAGPDVAGELVAGDPGGAARAAHLLRDCDVVVVQHEYGVYGGPDGDEVLALLAALTVPSVVVVHTVLTEPTARQREVLEAVVAASDAVVTMTTTAYDRLAAGYTVDMGKVHVIPHGAPPVHRSHSPNFRTGQPTVLTWGLLGPGKGIEWGIEAMGLLRDLEPVYVVAGQTHPKVLLREGEAYRAGLTRQIQDLGLAGSVTLDNHYRHSSALADLVTTADVVLLPYDSTEQVTSGVLIEAVAALKPVVATRFPHAVELLENGAGILVPHKDPAAIAAALRTVLTQRALAARMTIAAVASAPELLWPAVAEHYRALAVQLVQPVAAA